MSNNPISMEDLKNLAYSPAGQQLLQLLQNQNAEDLQLAMQKAASGDMKAAKAALSGMMQDPRIKNLLDQMGR